MSKDTYLARLEALLAGIPPEERQAAMEYYTDYLEDAGPEGEQAAMDHLGSPEKVAAAILEGLSGDTFGGEWTEKGYEASAPHRDVPDSREKIQKRERKKRGILGILILVAVMAFCGIPVFTIIASVALAAAAAVVTVCFGGIVVVLALAVAGIALIISGLIKIVTSPGMGAMLAGSGFLCLAAALLLLLLCLWMFRTVIPGILNGISRLFYRIFGKGGRRK